MPRPKKSEEDLRTRLEIYLTAAERSELKSAAGKLSVSQYLLALHRGADPLRTQRRQDVLSAFVTAQLQLQSLVAPITAITSPIDAVRILSQLIDIEREFRFTARLPVGWRTEGTYPDVRAEEDDAP